MNTDDPNHPDNQIPEAEVVTPTTAVTTRPAQPVAPAPAGSPPVVNAEQAKVAAIADLTKSAYSRASELKLTPDEIKGLEEDFGDDAFKPGAAGKENLIYIEHAFLRERFNKVFGHGQWAIVPRSRWKEDFTIPAKPARGNYAAQPAKQATRVYVEAMLLVRGCFVAEAVGDMVYYPNNESQNYGDAVEGAKTAALRRCAKELGVGLQAWKKDWCQGWWDRNPNGRAGQGASGAPRGSQRSTPPPATQPAPPSAPKPASTTQEVLPHQADAEQKTRFLSALEPVRSSAMGYFLSKGAITDTQRLEDLPLSWVPATKKQYEHLMAEIEAFGTRPPAGAKEPWRDFIVPFGKTQGMRLEDLDKNALYGWVMNFEVETTYQGNPRPQDKIDADTVFRKHLDEAGRHYGWIKS